MIEDDGRVGYAYLLNQEGKVCGDVWLYNRGPAPKEPEWSDREKAPYANPESYVLPKPMFSLPTSIADFSIEWRHKANGIREARVYIRGDPRRKNCQRRETRMVRVGTERRTACKSVGR